MKNDNWNLSESASQCAKIRAWLLDGRSITSWQAIVMFGCTRLAARIHNLREQGLDIVVRKRLTEKGSFIAEYSLRNA